MSQSKKKQPPRVLLSSRALEIHTAYSKWIDIKEVNACIRAIHDKEDNFHVNSDNVTPREAYEKMAKLVKKPLTAFRTRLEKEVIAKFPQSPGAIVDAFAAITNYYEFKNEESKIKKEKKDKSFFPYILIGHLKALMRFQEAHKFTLPTSRKYGLVGMFLHKTINTDVNIMVGTSAADFNRFAAECFRIFDCGKDSDVKAAKKEIAVICSSFSDMLRHIVTHKEYEKKPSKKVAEKDAEIFSEQLGRRWRFLTTVKDKLLAVGWVKTLKEKDQVVKKKADANEFLCPQPQGRGRKNSQCVSSAPLPMNPKKVKDIQFKFQYKERKEKEGKGGVKKGSGVMPLKVEVIENQPPVKMEKQVSSSLSESYELFMKEIEEDVMRRTRGLTVADFEIKGDDEMPVHWTAGGNDVAEVQLKGDNKKEKKKVVKNKKISVDDSDKVVGRDRQCTNYMPEGVGFEVVEFEVLGDDQVTSGNKKKPGKSKVEKEPDTKSKKKKVVGK